MGCEWWRCGVLTECIASKKEMAITDNHKNDIIKTISNKIKDSYMKNYHQGSYEHNKIMEDLGSMDLDDDTYQDIIDKVGAEINGILEGMKNDKEMKQKFINDLYKDKPADDESFDAELAKICDDEIDSPLGEYYIQDVSEKSKRLMDSSDHSYTNPKTHHKGDKHAYDSEIFRDNKSSLTNEEDGGKEYIGAHSFTAHELLGTGSFGEVYLVEKISDNSLHAMKVLCKDKIFEHKLARYAMTERNVLSVINHPFIVKLNFSFQTQNELFLILQYCPGGDLSEYLHVEKKFNEYKARIYCAEVLLALEELHSKDIIFRDLKPDNVVLDEDGHALLTDFGLSKEGVYDFKETKSFCGSYAYLAPEMVQKSGHGKSVDWYLFGVFMYEMLVGIPPYYDNDRDVLFYNIINEDLEIPSYISKEARDLIVLLMDRNPVTRLGTNGALEIKKHKWFKGIDWEDVFNKKLDPPLPYLKRKVKKGNGQIIISHPLDFEKERMIVQSDPNFIDGWSFIDHKLDVDLQ